MITLFLILSAIFGGRKTTVVEGHWNNTKYWGKVWIPKHKRRIRKRKKRW